jgi:hypothetical protein
MSGFRLLLIVFTLVIVAVTIAAISNEGLNLLPHFVQPILSLTWQGQFNLDFATYLILSGVWMAWRGGFTGSSIALGILAPPLGILFLAPYLIYLIGKTGGDARKLLLGVHATC